MANKDNIVQEDQFDPQDTNSEFIFKKDEPKEEEEVLVDVEEAEEEQEDEDLEETKEEEVIEEKKEEEETELDVFNETDYQEEEKKEGEDLTINPEDEALISKVVEKKLAVELSKRDVVMKRMQEVEVFLASNKQFKKFSSQIRKVALDPKSYNFKIDFIAKGVAGDELMRMGANEARQSDEERKKSSLNVGKAPKQTSVKDIKWTELSNDQFDRLSKKLQKKSQF